MKARTVEPGAGQESSGEKGSRSCWGNKAAEAPITAPKRRLLPHFPGLCLKQSGAIAFCLFGLGWVWGFFATRGRKSNSLLVLHLELALLQGYIAELFLFPFTSWALPTSYPVRSEPSRFVPKVHRTRMYDWSDFDSNQEPPCLFSGAHGAN